MLSVMDPGTGAVTTIIALLRKPENRSAAVTMLGKTVELCLQQVTRLLSQKFSKGWSLFV